MSLAKLRLQLVLEDMLSAWMKKFVDEFTVIWFVQTSTVSERMRLAAMELGGTSRLSAVLVLIQDREL